MMDCCDVPAPQPKQRYFPDEIILYGVPLDSEAYRDRTALIPFDKYVLALQVHDASGPVGSGDVAIAVIYGYAFEGGCYRFDRPRLMIFEARQKSASGCGFEQSMGYFMWRLSSKQQIILELNSTVDIAETIILTNSLPGKRSPNTFSASMQLAHRGGRLTNNGSV
jgi:hypothetical protein